VTVNRKENAATQTAALIIPAVGNNKLRHETLQRFMLANDSVTVAIEVPIWLTENDIRALEVEHGVELAPRLGGGERTITGHIDFLQVRNGCVHVLDFKPDARTNKPIAQLAIYALALTPNDILFDVAPLWHLPWGAHQFTRGAVRFHLKEIIARLQWSESGASTALLRPAACIARATKFGGVVNGFRFRPSCKPGVICLHCYVDGGKWVTSDV
jgi:PD-(D/E)XK nuclease superfamily